MSKPDETLKSIDETLKIGIFQIESNGEVKFINKFGANILGYDSADEIIGSKFGNYFADIKVFKEWLDLPDENEEFAISCLRKDGQEIAVSLSKSHVNDRKDNVLRIDGFVRDTQGNAEEELEKKIIANISEILISNLDIREVYQRICDELRPVIDWDRVSITLRELEGTAALNFLVTKGTEESSVSKALGAKGRYPFIGSILEKVVRAGKPVIAGDTLRSINETDKIFAEDGFRSRLAFPLKARSKVIGSVNFSCKKVGYYNDRHVKLLERVVPFLAIAIENTKLFIRATKSEEEYKELFKTTDSAWL